jgi:hypothetical protein
MSHNSETTTKRVFHAVNLVEPLKSGGLLNNAIRKGVLGSWLIFLYVASSWLVVYAFSAHQFNNAITNVEKIEGVRLTRWQIKKIYLEWAPQQAKIDVINDAILKHTVDIQDLATKRQEAYTKYYKNEASVRTIIGKISDLAAVNGMKKYIVQAQFGSDENITAPPQAEIDELLALPGIVVLSDELTEAKSAREESNGLIAGIDDTIQLIDQDTQKLHEQLDRVQRGLEHALTLKINNDERIILPPKVGDFLNELVFFKPRSESRLLVGFIKTPNPERLIDMPPEMLTLVLVLCMGALGSTIHLTQVYFNQRSNPVAVQRENGLGFWYFLFRPLQGCVTALAVYIFFKAGILVASTPSAGDQGAQISPYFVSFIGIISGLLAQNAIEAIQRVGKSWFSNSTTLGRERWAVGLDAKINSDKKPKDEVIKGLANQTGINEDGIKNWAMEKDSVPYKHQPIIAAFFRVSVREIFSDLQPRPAPVTQQDPDQNS